MKFNNDFFKKVKNKTNVDKDTIIELAKEVNNGDLKDEDTLRNVIRKISELTNKDVSKEKEDKIINIIMKDNIPNNVDKMF